MKIFSFVFYFFIICSALNLNGQESIALIPKPVKFVQAGGSIALFDIKRIAYGEKNESWIKIAQWIKTAKIAGQADLTVSYEQQLPIGKSIYLQKIKGTGHPEYYRMKVTKSGVLLEAYTDRGLFYAAQSLIQLAQTTPRKDTLDRPLIPYCSVEDQPAFDYRGLHLDVGRHFFSVAFLKQYLDLMARFKYNYFHWHLTEDQGWRIEIKKYPELVNIGSNRKETLEGHASNQMEKYDGKSHSGYYTQEEIKEVISYAADRYIEIIPEIEMPGHSLAALASYPEFGCTGGPYEVATKWGVFEDVFCTKDTSLQFLKDILDEVCNLFPGKYIHIGGDEVPKTRWKNCKHCQAVMRRNALRSEEELQSYFIKQIDLHLSKKGKQLVGWDEILEGGLSQNAIVMSWRGTEGGIAAAKQKHKAIMSPGSHCYFDHYASLSANEPLAIGGFTSLEKTYSYDPIPDALPAEFHHYIMGAQGNVWTEYMKDPRQVLYMAYPRAIALSEVNWTKKTERNYSDFLQRLQYHVPYFKSLNMNIARHMLELTYDIQPANQGMAIILKRPPVKGKTLVEIFRDGDYNQEYISHDTFILDKDLDFKIWYQLSDNTLGNPLHIKYTQHKACGAKLNFESAPSKKYQGSGEHCVVNGIAAPGNRYGGGEWLGFEGKDAVCFLTLSEIKKCDSLYIQYYQSPASWIYGPKQVEVYSSNDGQNYQKIKSMEVPVSKERAEMIKLDMDGKETKHLKIHIKHYGKIEDGLPGAGHMAWLFVGEIMLK